MGREQLVESGTSPCLGGSLQMRWVSSRVQMSLFVNPVTGVKLVIYCDDFLVRGSGSESAKFHTTLESRFGCRPGSRQVLTPENPIEFTGVRISMEKGALADSYFMDQSEAIAKFLTQHDMCDVRCKETPMPDVAELFSDNEPVSAEVASWCKSVIGCLYFFVRASRWDVIKFRGLGSHSLTATLLWGQFRH